MSRGALETIEDLRANGGGDVHWFGSAGGSSKHAVRAPGATGWVMKPCFLSSGFEVAVTPSARERAQLRGDLRGAAAFDKSVRRRSATAKIFPGPATFSDLVELVFRFDEAGVLNKPIGAWAHRPSTRDMWADERELRRTVPCRSMICTRSHRDILISPGMFILIERDKR